MDKKAIAECRVTGNQALSFVSDNYEGPCVLSYESSALGRSNAVFPKYSEARKAASWAVRVDLGGYSDVEVNETNNPAGFNTAEEWFFD